MSTVSVDVALPPGRCTLLSALRACLAAAGDPRDLADIGGLTGLSWYINVDRTVSPSGIAAYPWAQELPAMASRLGYDLAVVYADDEDPRIDRARERAARTAAESLDRGLPAILFGVHLPEFGLVRGYDPDARRMFVSGVLDGRAPDAIPVDQLGRGDVPVVLLAALQSGRADLDPDVAGRAAVRAAVRRARGVGPRLGGFDAGLPAWARWHDALDRGAIDPAGHAYTLHAVAELRATAAPFLDRLGPAFAEAAPHCRRTCDLLLALAADTPWPLPEGYGLSTTARVAARDAIAAAADAEARAIDAMERGLREGRRSRARRDVRVREAGPADVGALFRYAEDIPLADVAAAADRVRAAVRDRLGATLRAAIAETPGGDVAGALVASDLADADAPLDAAGAGRYLYVFSVWVARDWRDAGIDERLIEWLDGVARAGDYAGALAEATQQEVYLYWESFAALGFDVVARCEDALAMYRPVAGPAPRVRFSPPPPADPAGPLPVVVAPRRPCPVLAAACDNVIAAARAAIAAGAAIDLQVRDAPPNEIAVGGRRLPLGYLPRDGAEQALAAAAAAWRRRA
ncbi:MAG: hypothetical protein D6689_09620 [Deltaproteobacteria bacterium]|nr:MAG: hypothetical protein D6689_09620 [Deltaproteobacteria bacterium]